MEHFKQPSEMSFTTRNVPEPWKTWHQKFENFMIVTEKYGKLNQTKNAILLSLLNDEGISVFNMFKFATNKSKENYADIITKFTEYCVLCQNVVFEQYNILSIIWSLFWGKR